jgi:hypothetical protein
MLRKLVLSAAVAAAIAAPTAALAGGHGHPRGWRGSGERWHGGRHIGMAVGGMDPGDLGGLGEATAIHAGAGTPTKAAGSGLLLLNSRV